MVNKILENYKEKVYNGPNGDALFRLDLTQMQEEHDKELQDNNDFWHKEIEKLEETIEDLRIEIYELKEENEE